MQKIKACCLFLSFFKQSLLQCFNFERYWWVGMDYKTPHNILNCWLFGFLSIPSTFHDPLVALIIAWVSISNHKRQFSKKSWISLVVFTDRRIFSGFQAENFLTNIQEITFPLKVSPPKRFTHVSPKSAEITRWLWSSCLSTVLSVYLLLQGRPSLCNSSTGRPEQRRLTQSRLGHWDEAIAKYEVKLSRFIIKA